jgi:hypothetical protein
VILVVVMMTVITFALVNSKQEVKLVPALNESPRREGSVRVRMISFIPLLQPSKMRLGVPQSQCGRFEEDKNFFAHAANRTPITTSNSL